MRRAVIATMPRGGEDVAPALGARERDGEGRRAAATRTNATPSTRRGRRAFTLPTWFNIAATGAAAAAIAASILLQG